MTLIFRELAQAVSLLKISLPSSVLPLYLEVSSFHTWITLCYDYLFTCLSFPLGCKRLSIGWWLIHPCSPPLSRTWEDLSSQWMLAEWFLAEWIVDLKAIYKNSGRCSWSEKSFKRIMDMDYMPSREGWSIWGKPGQQGKLTGYKWRIVREGVGYLMTNVNYFDFFLRVILHMPANPFICIHLLGKWVNIKLDHCF